MSRQGVLGGIAPRPPRYWVGVACSQHVGRGLAGGFAQLCHGKQAPLARMQPGDGMVYYSAVHTLQGREPCQQFTALGYVADGGAYQVAMGEGFVPWRRDIHWLPGQPAAIRPLLHTLSFIENPARWGYPLRYGHLEISAGDFALIAHAMGITLPPSTTT